MSGVKGMGLGLGLTAMSGGAASEISIPVAVAGAAAVGLGTATTSAALLNMFEIQVSQSASDTTSSSDENQSNKNPKQGNSGTGNNAGKNSGTKPGEVGSSDYMLGDRGTKVSSKTTWKNGKTERIDVENPAPGERPGQVHYHDSYNNKFYYNRDTNTFYNQKTGELAPNSVQKLLKDKEFMKGIQKALQILGE